MADFTVGVSLKAFRDGSLTNSATLVTSPIPFSGLRSIDVGNQSSLKGLYLPINQFEYSFYNDFTIECFLRGDGTTNDGGFLNFNIQNGSGYPDNLNFMIDGDELQLNNYEFPGTGYRKKIGVDIGTRTTTDWYHFACVRKDNKYSLFWNGNRVAYDVDSAGNGTADTINIDSDDAYLFEPFGGNNPANQGRLPTVLLGAGGNKPSDQSGSFFWGGYIANYRTSYIAQYDPSSSTYTVPSAAFSNFSGTTTYYKDSTNNDLYNESDNLPTTFNDLVLENASLGDVTVEVIPGVVAFPTGVSASTSLGDLVPDSEVVGVSLQAGEGRLVNSATSVATPIPFTGLRSIDCGNQSTTNLLSMPFQELEYSYYNDFTVECFLRGDGTTNDGGFVAIEISNGLGNVDDLYLYIDGNNLQLNNFKFPPDEYRKKIEVDIGSRTTTDWYHVALIRKNNKYSIFWNGNRVVHDVDSAGNGTADTINITSEDAYLFKPFGGNNASGQGQVNNVNYGTGGNSVSGGTNKRWGGYMANIRTSYIAQYDPANATIDIPTAPFDDDASGQSYYYKNETTFQQLNSSTTLPSSFNDLNFTAALGSVSVELLQEVLANGSLLQVQEGTVDLSVQLDPIVPTGQNLTTSLGTAAAGPGILVPSTGQNLTISLGDIILPVSWGNVTTGTTSTWTPVDTGDKAIGP